jgi:heat shock protein HtpX
MVTMTLLQGVINVFVLFLAHVIAFLMSRNSSSENRGGGSNFMMVMLLQFVLSLLGSMVVAAFSRWREYRADAGGARLAGRQKMISALQALQDAVRRRTPVEASGSLATLKISGQPGGFMALFSTHPPLEDRIARLKSDKSNQSTTLID